MSSFPTQPTPDAELNDVLRELVTRAQAVLSDNFVGAYLQGSFAVGDWDVHSDVDFLIVVERDLTEGELTALQAMHQRIYALPSPWAQHLEGSYFPRALLRSEDPARTPLWYLDNGSQELVRSDHDNDLVVRWVTRERGITLAGPTPDTLIDPIAPDDLKRQVRATMRQWAHLIFTDPQEMSSLWYQAFAVVTYCRMLHTLQTGTVESKRAGVEWVQQNLNTEWSPLIAQAWKERPDPPPYVSATPADLERTHQFIRHALEIARQQDGAV